MEEFGIGILSSLAAAAILFIMNWLAKIIAKKKYAFLLGDWFGYYFIKNGTILMSQKISITYGNFRGLKIVIEESSSANFIYEGRLEVVDDRLFGYLRGKTHEARSNLVMILPFNRKTVLPSLNGIFSGITQDKYPASTKIHWSRSIKKHEEVQKELGSENLNIIVRNDTVENEARRLSEEIKNS